MSNHGSPRKSRSIWTNAFRAGGVARVDVLIVFAKAARPGRAKTRLAADPRVGLDGAARLAEAFLRDTLDHASSVPGVELVLEYAPSDERAWFEALDERARLEPQADGDLGERMRSSLEREFARGARRVVIVGSDTPHLEPASIERAFAALIDADLVLGPSSDGGYYLVGLRRRADALFQGVAWSTSSVLSKTLELARASNLSSTLLEMLTDVDEHSDLERLLAAARAGRGHCPSTLAAADSLRL